ncbi:MAG: MBL fold metallo-hydrolase [Desulfobulbaceae bacterium]|nr:MBL fold metallo-hydrolase [Desulfobulbaceae bacterium]
MLKSVMPALLSLMLFISPAHSMEIFEKDTISTSAGDLVITFIGHSSLMFTFNGKTIHVDPYSRLADYDQLPEADFILITHHHRDHLDLNAIEKVDKGTSKIILTDKCAQQLSTGIIMKNGDNLVIDGIKIKAVPAYNLVHKRENGHFFHPKGEGNGYILAFGNKNVYIAGDTENTPEMKSLNNIDIAFLPMNLPYTMTPEMVADAAKAFKPKVLYPYHYGETDISELVKLLDHNPDIELRIRKMK